MPTIHGARECRDKIWYDTGFIEPGQGDGPDRWRNQVRLFGLKNIGEYHKTNIQNGGILHYELTCIVHSLGVRLIGKTREEEDLLLDHLRVTLTLGDIPQFDIMGPHASTLRHVFSKEELDRLAVVADDHPDHGRMGYQLRNPVVVPVRQNLSVEVSAAEQLPEAVNFRVYLFGEMRSDYP